MKFSTPSHNDDARNGHGVWLPVGLLFTGSVPKPLVGPLKNDRSLKWFIKEEWPKMHLLWRLKWEDLPPFLQVECWDQCRGKSNCLRTFKDPVSVCASGIWGLHGDVHWNTVRYKAIWSFLYKPIPVWSAHKPHQKKEKHRLTTKAASYHPLSILRCQTSQKVFIVQMCDLLM